MLYPTSTLDILVNVEVVLLQRGFLRLATVIQSNSDYDNRVTVDYIGIPLSGTMLYNSKFPGSTVKLDLTNRVTGNILNQIEEAG